MPLHVRCKLFLKALLPQSAFAMISKFWRRNLAQYFTDTQADSRYFDAFKKEYGLSVIGGPFAGLKYIPESAGSVLLLKLIGAYEAILHAVIREVKEQSFDTIIDIGCAEGYYLIGLGKNKPDAKLIGYDIDTEALSLTKKLADYNGLKNSLILDTDCTFEKLQANITSQTLLICDAEGFESQIINPELCLALRDVKLFIIETHDFAAPGVVAQLQQRLAATHAVETITFSMAKASDYPFLDTITNKKHLYHLMRERGEQEQQWIIARRK